MSANRNELRPVEGESPVETTGTHRRPSDLVPKAPSRVLFVDDEEILLRAFRRALYGEAVQLDVAAGAAPAFPLLGEHEYDVIVSDYRMPEMNGLDFLRKAHEQRPGASLILASAHADMDVVLTAVNDLGIFRLLLKPWDVDQVRRAIREAVEVARLRSDNDAMRVALDAKARDIDRVVHERSVSYLAAVVDALDRRDTGTRGHTRRVKALARRLAESMGLREPEVIEIERGVLLHDIGKIAVRDAVLRKSEPLDAAEMIEMRAHVQEGEQILRPVNFVGRGRLVVAQHHERWDGTGYPRRLRGEDIYVGARIFAVCDAYDAARRETAGRKALSHAAAVAALDEGSGTEFDPGVVTAFRRVPENEIDAILDRARARLDDQGDAGAAEKA